MKFILPETRFAKTWMFTVFAALLLTTGLTAQTKKKSTQPAKKTVAKKTVAPAKDARKSGKKEVVAKRSTKSDTKKSAKATAAKTSKQSANAKTAKVTKKPDAKQTAKQKRAEEARRRQEEVRRQAAIAAERRRQEAIRIARERKLAFERGLKYQTAENIIEDNIEGEDLVVRKAAIVLRP
jgi:outer membrane biosynthesis protein TonB